MVLESAWTVISLWGLYDYIIRKTNEKINLNDCKKGDILISSRCKN
jgi:hypothetical protein